MLWDSRGASQVKASINQMQQGMSQYKRELQGVGREQSQLDKQIRAFGTTLRYALAGGAIFGTINAITKLGDFQEKLGTISAIGSSGQYPLVGKQLDQLGDSLLRISTETVTPIGSLEDAVANLYSTIDGLSPDQAVTTIETIAKTSRTAQADITDTTQAVLGMSQAFDKSLTDVESLGDAFFVVTKLASGGLDFSRIYSQQLGALSQSALQGGFTVEQMSALAIAGSKFGGSPAKNLRAQQQLQRQIMTPGNVKSESFYQRAGVGKMARREMQGWDVLMKLLTYANKLPEGRRREFMTGAFTRAESRNIATTIAKSLTEEQTLGAGGVKQRFTLDQLLMNYLAPEKRRGQQEEAFGRYIDMTAINQAGQAMQNFSVAVADAWSPLINPAAKGMTKASLFVQRQSSEHPEGVMAAMGLGAAGLFGARMLSKGKAGKLLGGLGRGGMQAAAVSDIMTGGKVRGDSPMNPLYVVMVSELLGRRGGYNQYPLDATNVPGPPGKGRAATRAGQAGSIFRKFGGLLGAAPLAKYGVRVPIGLGALATAEIAALLATPGAGHTNDVKNLGTAFPRLTRLTNRRDARACSRPAFTCPA